jgi:choline-glycine betaine transporter
MMVMMIIMIMMMFSLLNALEANGVRRSLLRTDQSKRHKNKKNDNKNK